jgi:hypothetical protein
VVVRIGAVREGAVVRDEQREKTDGGKEKVYLRIYY